MDNEDKTAQQSTDRNAAQAAERAQERQRGDEEREKRIDRKRGQKQRRETINVVKPFTLTKQDGSVHHFGVGEQEVDEDVADHWYVQHHTDDPPEYNPPPGTPEYAAREAGRARRDALLQAAREQEADNARDDTRARQRQRPRLRETFEGQAPFGDQTNTGGLDPRPVREQYAAEAASQGAGREVEQVGKPEDQQQEH